MSTGTGIFWGLVVLSAVIASGFLSRYITARKKNKADDVRRRVGAAVAKLGDMCIDITPQRGGISIYESRDWGTMITFTSSAINELMSIEPHATTVTIKHRNVYGELEQLLCDPTANDVLCPARGDSLRWPDQETLDVFMMIAYDSKDLITAWVIDGEAILIIDPFGEITAAMLMDYGITFTVKGMEFVYRPISPQIETKAEELVYPVPGC